MKTIKVFALLLILCGTSCDNNMSEYRDIPKEILNDQDFERLIELSIVLNHEIMERSQNRDLIKLHETQLKGVFDLLINRYDSFHENAQKALSDNSTSAFSNLTIRLQKRISINKALLNYDAPSVCGNPCGSTGATSNAMSCLAGCQYSSAYCLFHGGSQGLCSGDGPKLY